MIGNSKLKYIILNEGLGVYKIQEVVISDEQFQFKLQQFSPDNYVKCNSNDCVHTSYVVHINYLFDSYEETLKYLETESK
jgi:hypothetical protein